MALVRLTGIEGLTPKSVKKKMNDEHVAFVIAALQRADELGLTGAGS